MKSNNIMNIRENVIKASERLKGHIRYTPFEKSTLLSELTGSDVWLKLENLQYTGSFKFRGAMNKMLSLSKDNNILLL